MRKTCNLTITLAIFAALQTGCGGKEETPPPDPTAAPKAVALTMLRAMDAGDGQAAVACYRCNAEDKEYMIKTMPFLSTVKDLVTAGIKAYGSSDWYTANDKTKVGMIMPEMENAETNIQCEIDGETARCILRGLPRPLLLSKIDGQWLIVPAREQLPPLHQRGDILNSMYKAKTAIEAIIPKVGAEGVSAEDICNEVRIIVKSL